jgi:hypothetical protein
MTETQTHEALADVAEQMPDAKVGTAPGIAAIALSMAMKYHDMSMVKDGTLYQQYKLEGKNMMPIHLDMVFETAIQIERHLLASSQRIADLVVEALEVAIVGDEADASNQEGEVAP